MSDDLPWLSPSERFPDTRPSVLERLRTGPAEVRTEAFGALVTGYWRPVYRYLRLKWQLDEDAAADATQAFLAAAFGKAWFEDFDPARARFRTFLRVCLDRFVMKLQASERAERRGGGAPTLSLDFGDAEGGVGRIEPAVWPDEDGLFRQEVIRDLFVRALADVQAECEAGGRTVAFRVFERYDIEDHDGLTYHDVAKEFGIPATQVTNYLAAMRRRFRVRALEHLRALSGSDEEFRTEARELFGVDVA